MWRCSAAAANLPDPVAGPRLHEQGSSPARAAHGQYRGSTVPPHHRLGIPRRQVLRPAMATSAGQQLICLSRRELRPEESTAAATVVTRRLCTTLDPEKVRPRMRTFGSGASAGGGNRMREHHIKCRYWHFAARGDPSQMGTLGEARMRHQRVLRDRNIAANRQEVRNVRAEYRFSSRQLV
jgi:hypothetical protein